MEELVLLWTVAIISWVISIFCFYNLWRRRGPLLKKLFWSMILILPILGPLSYGALYIPPSELTADLKAPEYDPTRHGLGDNYDHHSPENH